MATVQAVEQEVTNELIKALTDIRPDLSDGDRREQAHFLFTTMSVDDIFATLEELDLMEVHGRE